MHLTTKQLEVVRIVVAGNPDGTPADLDELLERLSYKPTKEAVQFSVRALIRHGLIEKVGSENRRGRRRVLIGATDMGRHFAGPRRGVSFVSTEAEDEVFQELQEAIS